MSKAVRDIRPAENPGNVEMPFEEALKKLESIVDAMENEELPLESLLSRYEEGTKLVQVCQKKLEEAEVKVQRLEKTSNGQFALTPVPIQPEGEE